MQYFLIVFFSFIFYLGVKNCNDNEVRIAKCNDDELIETPFYIYKMSKKECLTRLVIVKALLYFLMILAYIFIIMISIFNTFIVSNLNNNLTNEVYVNIITIIVLIWSIVSLIFFLKINLFGEDYLQKFNKNTICSINYRIIKNAQKKQHIEMKSNIFIHFFILFYTTLIIIAMLQLTHSMFCYLK